jgi:hypothetical protein
LIELYAPGYPHLLLMRCIDDVLNAILGNAKVCKTVAATLNVHLTIVNVSVLEISKDCNVLLNDCVISY